MFTPPPDKSILRKMGYISDQKGIINRYFREHIGWSEHIRNTRDFILRCLSDQPVTELVVLGSGWLLDFPLEDLYRKVRKITLIDICHPPQVQKKIKSFPGVECVAADITGGFAKKVFDSVSDCRRKRTPYCFDDKMTKPEIEEDDGRVFLSLNILNQLDILIVDYIKSRVPVTDENILKIRQKLQQEHMNLLMGRRFILVTDYKELIYNKDGEEESSVNLLYTDLPPASHSEQWIWQFDNKGMYNPGRKTFMKVIGMSS